MPRRYPLPVPIRDLERMAREACPTRTTIEECPPCQAARELERLKSAEGLI